MSIRTIKKNFIRYVSNYEWNNESDTVGKNIKKNCKKIIKTILSEKWIRSDELQKISMDELYSIWKFLLMQKSNNTKEKYKEELTKNWWFDLNIDLWKFCWHECSHCSISASQKYKKIDMSKLLNKFNNLEWFINKISFYDIWEFFDNENYPELLEYFLSKWINDFSMVSRWSSLINWDEIYTNLEKLKNKYPEFHFWITLSIDFFSKIPENKSIKSLQAIYKTQKEIFNNDNIGFSLSLPQFEWMKHTEWNTTEKQFNEFISEYINHINKVLKVVWDYDIDLPEENYYYEKDVVQPYIEKIKLSDNSVINLRNNIIWAKWRWKQIVAEKNMEVKMPIYKCAVTEEPYSLNIMNNWDFKLCYQNDVAWCHNFTYANIEDSDFLEKIIKIRTDYYNTITVLDLLWRWKKHFCASMNLQKGMN